ncbi:MAG: hypothetical protein ACPGQQ_10295 [Candidatus Puniceispirillaceae bacterium]
MGFGGGTPGDMGGGQGGYGPDTDLSAFGGAGASIADITSGSRNARGESLTSNDDSGNGGSSETTQQMRERIQAQQAAQSQQASDRAQSAINQAIRERLSDPLLPQNVSRGFGQGATPISQLFARQYNQPLPNIGLLGVTLNSLAGRVPQGIADRLGKGGTPVYDGTGQIVGVMGEGLFGSQAYYGRPGFDPLQTEMETVKDAAGNIIGYKTDSLTGTFGDDDGGESPLPGVPTTAAVTEAAPEALRAAPEYIYPEGGFFPETGRYYRRGLLDIDPGGLLDFTARNEAFRRGMATDASLYGMPFDLTGYTLL